MMRLLLMVIVALAGCATAPAPLRVDTPVALPCPPPPIAVRPALPISQITRDSPPASVLRAYVATVEVLMGYSLSLETLLSGYKEE